MRLNVFKIPDEQTALLRSRLDEVGLTVTTEVDQAGWSGKFLFSDDPQPGAISWVTTFADYLSGKKYYNRSYFAVFLLNNAKTCYAISFGKAHFYVRPYCDYDFGIELAKRIADAEDIAQTAAKRFQGKQRKSIRSFSGHARLNVPPGESVDFLQASIIPASATTYGKTGKFGTSALLSPDITPDGIGQFLTTIEAELAKPERFKLPRTVVLTEKEEVARFDEKLLDELTAPIGTSELTANTFELFGVDFVFGSLGTFRLRCGHYKAVDLEQLTMKDVKQYIADRKIPRGKLLQLRVTRISEDGPDVVQPIKEAVDFICDDDRVVLTGGKWLKFNQDYLDFLNESIRDIAIEEVEPQFARITVREGDFNAELVEHGYQVADKDFEILKTSAATPVEAWDLSKDTTVYAVKFGTPQKLNYVVDQAMNVLELLHNKAGVKSVPDFERYCLWLGYRAKNLPDHLADSGSIILKQKIDAWARRCDELGITPVVKLSLAVKPEAGDA
ncbi:hypothetical protein D9V37_09130 [Nocardioides mangrovicus]|uniref:Sporadically distributed protein, TIGR04141 family n=1 Tax=Nocardioides mangrovicus TaxID=2478913 RepID=A0A3L8P3Q4_9ACTN|nr:DUF6119 family protein [Nocardioides mangrovicus]RLV50020.1 hypothetical protein D9V37_09130 [Nocardioides mangrovicus]